MNALGALERACGWRVRFPRVQVRWPGSIPGRRVGSGAQPNASYGVQPERTHYPQAISAVTAARLARIHMEATTYTAGYRERRMTRRERKATVRVLVLVVFCLVPFAVRMVVA